MQNLFEGVSQEIPREMVDILVENRHVRLERIVSTGQNSPPGFWYDQDEHEWVVVLKGEARLQFEGTDSVHLTTGDYLLIPAHRRHRVEWTTSDGPTIWLALFYRDSSARNVPTPD